ncbi:MAG: asparagine synthase-related protein, partial [Rhodospirillales bacterium]
RADRFDGNRGLYCHEHTTHFPAPALGLIGHAGAAPAAAQAALFEAFMAGPDRDPQAGALVAVMGSYLPDDLLTLLDRTTMAVSVEGRVPYLDHRVVEAALAVPPAVRTPGDRWKGLQRSLARRFLPDAVLKAPKQGFASPVPAWIRADLGPMAERLLKRRETLDRGWWTAAGVDRLLASPDRHGFRIYTLLMLELAVRLFCEQQAYRRPPAGGLEAMADAA